MQEPKVNQKQRDVIDFSEKKLLLVVKGWGGHREGTNFESQWRQRMKKRQKKITYKKEDINSIA